MLSIKFFYLKPDKNIIVTKKKYQIPIMKSKKEATYSGP